MEGFRGTSTYVSVIEQVGSTKYASPKTRLASGVSCWFATSADAALQHPPGKLVSHVKYEWFYHSNTQLNVFLL